MAGSVVRSPPRGRGSGSPPGQSRRGRCIGPGASPLTRAPAGVPRSASPVRSGAPAVRGRAARDIFHRALIAGFRPLTLPLLAQPLFSAAASAGCSGFFFMARSLTLRQARGCCGGIFSAGLPMVAGPGARPSNSG